MDLTRKSFQTELQSMRKNDGSSSKARGGGVAI